MKVVKSKKDLSPKKRALLIADFAYEKKAENITILDMRKVTNFCDFFVICSGSSDTRVNAIAQGVIEGLEQKSKRVYHTEGNGQANWVVIDLGDILVHVFDNDTRDFYNLEHLWQDAARVAYNKKSED